MRRSASSNNMTLSPEKRRFGGEPRFVMVITTARRASTNTTISAVSTTKRT
jgi:hypothetical protein